MQRNEVRVRPVDVRRTLGERNALRRRRKRRAQSGQRRLGNVRVLHARDRLEVPAQLAKQGMHILRHGDSVARTVELDGLAEMYTLWRKHGKNGASVDLRLVQF